MLSLGCNKSQDARWSLLALCALLAAFIFAPLASAQSLTLEQQLGKKLFFDASLSKTGNQSCGSCHAASVAFTDPDKTHATSNGDNPLLFGSRNTPMAAYAAFSPEFGYNSVDGVWQGGQFWDGRAANLEQQAQGPFINPIEMGNANRAAVIGKLASGANASLFQQVYGAGIFADVDTAYVKISQAIASYERSPEFSPFTSKYDYVLQGKAKLNIYEQRGLQAFNSASKGNCAACHISDPGPDGSAPLFTDFTYDNIGIPTNFQSDFLTNPEEFNPDGENFIDLGLGQTVGDPSLYGAFKVPSLRNVALTAPYGHNGWFDSLEELIDFYATRDVKTACSASGITAAQAFALNCWPSAELADTMNVDELGNLPLTARDKANIVAFLNTLTDGYIPASNVPEPATWAMLIFGFGWIGTQMRRKSSRHEEKAIA